MSSKFPEWLKVRAPSLETLSRMKPYIKDSGLHTVCESAMCPNIGKCFSKGTATFMILGDICTRNCRFCAVIKGNPNPIDLAEPLNVALSVYQMNLKYAVITSVTRDDLLDGGAGIFAQTINSIKQKCPDIKIEVLIPDFRAQKSSIEIVVNASPKVINHNLETVPALYNLVRPQADYKRSLRVLEMVKELDDNIVIKSGLMLGLGESRELVLKVMKDLRSINCDILTFGQYLQPTKNHLPVIEFIRPEIFEEYKKEAEQLGFRGVASGPLVRSSFQAEELFHKVKVKD